MEAPHRIKRCTSMRRGIDVAGALFVCWTKFGANQHQPTNEQNFNAIFTTMNMNGKMGLKKKLYRKTRAQMHGQFSRARTILFDLHWNCHSAVISPGARTFSRIYFVNAIKFADRSKCEPPQRYVPICPLCHWTKRSSAGIMILLLYLLLRSWNVHRNQYAGMATATLVPHSKCAFYLSNTISPAHNGGRRTHFHYIYEL